MNINDLSKFGINSEIIEIWNKERFKHQELPKLIEKAICDYNVFEGVSLLIVAPTGTGKTVLGEMTAVKLANEGRKAVFLLPLKTLVNEKYDDFKKYYKNLKVIRCSGDYSDNVKDFNTGNYDVAFFTYEKFLGVFIRNKDSAKEIDLIVIDEIHQISELNRGPALEILLTHLNSFRAENNKPQIIALSAVVGDVNSFDEWFNIRLLLHKEREVPLVEGIIDSQGKYKYKMSYKETSCKEIKQEQLLKPELPLKKNEIIWHLVKKRLSEDKNANIIIFRNTKENVVDCAKMLSEKLNLRFSKADLAEETDLIEELEEYSQNDPSLASKKLLEYLKSGVLFHTADLNKNERELVEEIFRKSKNIRVIVATTTLAAGVNTPASIVIIPELTRQWEKRKPDYSIAEYKNMAGRAGRKGYYNSKGESIIIAGDDGNNNVDGLWDKYIQGEPEPFESVFDHRQPANWFFKLLAIVNEIEKDKALDILDKTYGGFLRKKKIKKEDISLKDTLEEMLNFDLISEDRGLIKTTDWGERCSIFTFPYETLIMYLKLFKEIKFDHLSSEKLIPILQIAPDLNNIFMPSESNQDKIDEYNTLIEEYYGEDVLRFFNNPKIELDWDKLIKAKKRAIILYDWISGEKIKDIEDRYYIDSGRINNIVETTRLHLQSMQEIVNKVYKADISNEDTKLLIGRLQYGIPQNAIGLLNIDSQFKLNRGDYLKLFENGIKNSQDFFQTPKEKIAKILGKKRFKKISKLFENV